METRVVDYDQPGKLRRRIGRSSEAIIPEGTTRISYGELQNVKTLEYIHFPSTLQQIEPCAFSRCENLKYADIPDSVELVGPYAFEGCKSLERATVGKGVKTISTGCFRWCERLSEVILSEGLVSVEKEAFSGCRSLKDVYLPGSMKKVGVGALEYDRGNSIVSHLPEGFFKTKDKIDASLGVCLPDDVESLAYVLAFQSGKRWDNVLKQKARRREGKLFDCAIGLLSGDWEVDSSAAKNLTAYALENTTRIGKGRILVLHDTVAAGDSHCARLAKKLEGDARTKAFFEGRTRVSQTKAVDDARTAGIALVHETRPQPPDVRTYADGMGRPLSTVTLGRWPRATDGAPEPIEWLVLDEVDGRRLLLSKETLEHACYVGDALPRRAGIKVWPTWGYSDLRYWLNTTFLKFAFDDDERSRVAPTNLGPQDEPAPLRSAPYSEAFAVRRAAAEVEESRDMVDYVFCLSATEVKRYLGLNGNAATVPTPNAAAVIGSARAAYWWLRSNESGFWLIDPNGSVLHRQGIPGNSMKAVRPALWLASDSLNDAAIPWRTETRGHDYQVLLNAERGDRVAPVENAVGIAIQYGENRLAERLLEGGHRILWSRSDAIFKTWVGTATLGSVLRHGALKLDECFCDGKGHLWEDTRDIPKMALFWKRYSFVAKYYPDIAIKSWSKIKASPEAVRLLVPHLDPKTFRAKASLGVILADNGYGEEIGLLLRRGGFFTKATLARMRNVAVEAGQDQVIRLLAQ